MPKSRKSSLKAARKQTLAIKSPAKLEDMSADELEKYLSNPETSLTPEQWSEFADGVFSTPQFDALCRVAHKQRTVLRFASANELLEHARSKQFTAIGLCVWPTSFRVHTLSCAAEPLNTAFFSAGPPELYALSRLEMVLITDELFTVESRLIGESTPDSAVLKLPDELPKAGPFFDVIGTTNPCQVFGVRSSAGEFRGFISLSDGFSESDLYYHKEHDDFCWCFVLEKCTRDNNASDCSWRKSEHLAEGVEL